MKEITSHIITKAVNISSQSRANLLSKKAQEEYLRRTGEVVGMKVIRSMIADANKAELEENPPEPVAKKPRGPLNSMFFFSPLFLSLFQIEYCMSVWQFFNLYFATINLSYRQLHPKPWWFSICNFKNHFHNYAFLSHSNFKNCLLF